MMNKKNERCCGTCIYHEFEDVDWICNCPTSDLYTDWTDCECTCQEWEGSHEREY